MSQKGPFLFLVALLCIAGVGTAAFRHAEYRIPWLPGEQQNVWEIEARIEYMAQGVPTQAFLTLPPNQDGFRVVNETGASSGFGFEVETQRREGARVVTVGHLLVVDRGPDVLEESRPQR